MDTNKTKIDKEICNRFLPLNIIPPESQEELLKHAMMASFDVCRNIVKHTAKSSLYHYLVDGYAEVRHSFDKRSNISCNDEKCVYPLEEQIKEGGLVRAITPCRVLIVNRDYVDEIIARPESESYEIVHISNEEKIEEEKIDDDYKSDWMALFYQSQLAINLSPQKIQQVFSNLTNVKVKGGETIIECHTMGDYFYVIQEGYAEVVTEASGPFKGKKFELEPGDYFGDEALIAQTIRNARVVMTTDGFLGRMGCSVFNDIIKSALVVTPDVNEVMALTNPIYCDVRLPMEYKHEHLPYSVNIPVGRIRKNLELFDRDKIYIITPEGGRRSELAAYLMRQAGIEAYYMDRELLDALPDSLPESLSNALPDTPRQVGAGG